MIFVGEYSCERCIDSDPFRTSVAFYKETSHLICSGNQMAGFYMKCNTGLKWVKVVGYGNKFRKCCYSIYLYIKKLY